MSVFKPETDDTPITAVLNAEFSKTIFVTGLTSGDVVMIRQFQISDNKLYATVYNPYTKVALTVDVNLLDFGY